MITSQGVNSKGAQKFIFTNSYLLFETTDLLFEHYI